MKPDKFEQRLQRQTLRQVPAGWRGEILASASDAMANNQAARATPPSFLSTILWPHPKAWAGLAAVWIVILAVNFSMRDPTPVVAEKSAPPSPEVIGEMKQQRRLLAELIGPRDAPEADRSKPLVPRPRSECAEFMAA
jgi:hypothetical protein